MKKKKQCLYKTSLTLLVLSLLIVVPVIAQEIATTTDDQIALPDVNTELQLEKQNIEDAAIPDFTQVLPQIETDFTDLPVLKDGTDEKIALESIVQKTDGVDIPSVYLEGIIGGGYPGFFLGNFNVYQPNGNNPFSVTFSHEAINGYGRHDASDGYNNSETSLSGSKSIMLSDKLVLDGTALYNTSTGGLQSQSDFFYNMSRQYIGGTGKMAFQANDVFQLQTSLHAAYVSRFAGFTEEVLAGILTGSQLYTVSPKVDAIITKGILSLDFSSSYKFASMDSSVSINDKIMNHGDVNVASSCFCNDFFTLLTGIGVSFTSTASTIAVVPFYIGATLENPLVTLTAKGGLNSTQTDIASLQELYPFVHFEKVPTEESEWFGLLNMQIPFMQKYATIVNVEFNKTAFGNGRLWPDYTGKSASDLYDSTYNNVTELKTKMAFSVQFDTIGCTVGWNGNWLDKVDGTNIHELFTDVLFNTVDGKGTLQLEILQQLVPSEIPEIGCSAFYQFAQPFQLELSIEDMVFLFTGDDRIIAGDYCGQGGSVSLKMKLFF